VTQEGMSNVSPVVGQRRLWLGDKTGSINDCAIRA